MFHWEERITFQQKIKISFETGHYLVRTIETSDELHKVLALRRRAFPHLSERIKEFDYTADHLIAQDKLTGEICGAYRLSCSSHSKHFETEEDFNVNAMIKGPGVKVELAWACVAPEYRNGTVISALWEGIRSYLQLTRAQYAFGATSVMDSDGQRISDIQSLLKDLNSHPQNKSNKKILRALPTLLRAYILAGAFVFAQPIFDADLNCYDFMTVLEVNA
ncbi:GNAT family N-acetyltransferase [Bdellovibrio sp. BCCA]|uniref:GNAT family N-acetyltransferase n=1 Tax=Bdellovibrio sp. BCCA TaxID=3136281 RepID=UPI0030F115B5